MHLWVKGLPRDKDAVYEVLCDAENWTATAGTFRTNADGKAYVVLTTALRKGEYDAIRIVRRGHSAGRAPGQARRPRRRGCPEPRLRRARTALRTHPTKQGEHDLRRITWILALGLAALALAAAGCGGDDSGSDGTGSSATEHSHRGPTEAPTEAAGGGGAETLTVTADPDGAISWDKTSLSAKAGKVTLKLVNESSTPHAIEVEGNGVEERDQDDHRRRDRGHRRPEGRRRTSTTARSMTTSRR